MDDSLLLRALGSSPQLRAIDFFIENRIFDYSKSDVAKETGISRMTLDKAWDELISLGIIKETRRIGRATLYKLNTAAPLVKELIRLDQLLTRKYAEQLGAMSTVRT